LSLALPGVVVELTISEGCLLALHNQHLVGVVDAEQHSTNHFQQGASALVCAILFLGLHAGTFLQETFLQQTQVEGEGA
jgi:hypothetical protein